MSFSGRRWADIAEDDDYEIPVPLAFMVDDDVVDKLRTGGLPDGKAGLQLQKLLDGTDLGSVDLTRSSELTRGDIAHIKEHCYWYRNDYRPDY